MEITKQIIIADDDDLIIWTLTRFFSQLAIPNVQFALTTCNDGLQAWEKIDKANGNFDLLLTDYSMPKMMGDELAKKVKEKFPDLHIILATGKLNDLPKDLPNIHVVAKPFDFSKLKELILKLLKI